MEAVLFIGIQGTGKSTFYKKKFFNSHVRISLDLLNTRNKFRIFMQSCYDTHTQFVVDNTSPQKEDRKPIIEEAKANNYKVIGYYFNSAIQDAIERNNQREGKERIPEIGIRSCHSKLELPDWSDGYDELYYVSIKNNDFEITPWKNEI